MHAVTTIAHMTALAALRARLAWLVLACALLALGLGSFVHAIALAAAPQVELALMAPGMRLAAVLAMAAYASHAAAQDGHEQLLLALPVPRWALVLGRMLGFGLLATLPALAFGVIAFAKAPPLQAACWTLTLLLELWIVSAAAILCAQSLRHPAAAMAATLGFYVLARSAFGLAGMDGAGSHPGLQAAANLASILLPRLDLFARTEWLVYGGAQLSALLPAARDAIVFGALASGAALADYYRREA